MNRAEGTAKIPKVLTVERLESTEEYLGILWLTPFESFNIV
ncbi:MAG: hypothetical protein QXR65_06570 [Candidatus Bathyarchaeia archaeon]